MITALARISSTALKSAFALRLAMLRSAILRAGVLSGALLLASEALAEPRQFDIPSQSAEQSLVEFARQSGNSVLFPLGRIGTIFTPAIEGEYEVSEALALLLRGTGLTASIDARVITVRPAAATTAPVTLSSVAPVLEEIIVTAEKRETDLQQTPQVINFISGAMLAEAGVQQPQELRSLVPSLSMYRNGSNTIATIRGIGGALVLPGDQLSVAMVTDGVYSASGIATTGDWFDLGHVEVLKGPQGTLFGRNATAGVISLVTQPPRFENSASLRAEVGTFQQLGVTAVMNAALNEQFALRAGVNAHRHDGYFDDGFDDDNVRSARLRLLYQPLTNMTWQLSASYAQQRGRGSAYTPVDNQTQHSYAERSRAGPSAPANQAGAFAAWSGQYGQDARVNNLIWAVRPQLQWQLPGATLFAIASQQRALIDEVQADDSAKYERTVERSLEVRLASDEERRLRWLIGIYGYQQSISGEALVNIGGVHPGARVFGARQGQFTASELRSGTHAQLSDPYVTRDAALFTQETWHVSHSLRLTGGARWHYERVGRGNTDATDLQSGNVRHFDAIHSSWRQLTWKAGIELDVQPQSLGYFNVSTGWKAGAPQPYLPPYDQQRPEKLTAYSLGLKNRLLDSRLQVNGELFYWDYRDRQISFVADPVYDRAGNPETFNGGSGALVQGNAKRSHVQGLELDVAWQPTATDLLSFAVEYLQQAQYDEVGQDPTACAGCRMTHAPLWSGVLSYRHAWQWSDQSLLSIEWRSKLESDSLLALSSNSAMATQRGYTRSDVGLRYTPSLRQWNVRLYVNNLENRDIKSDVRTSPIASYSTVSYQAPRTIGVQWQIGLPDNSISAP